jgi:hypothetical protein
VITVPTADHNWNDESTCADCGYVCGHSYDNACDADCNECGATRTVGGHDYVGVETTPATCLEAGLKTYTCSCGDSYEETIKALGHDYESVVTDPTCQDEGYTTYACSRCDDTYDDDVTGIVDHVYENGACKWCGEAAEEVVLPASDLVFVVKSLSFQEYIGMQTIMMMNVVNKYDSVYIEANGEVINGFQYEKYYYVFDKQVLSTNMTEEITITIYGMKGEQKYVGETVTLSVEGMALKMLGSMHNDDKYAKECTVLVNMLKYGAAAQRYWYAQSDFTGTPLPFADENIEAYEHFATTADPVFGDVENYVDKNVSFSVQSVSTSISLQSILEINLVFTSDMTQYEAHVTVAGETETKVYGFDDYYGYKVLRVPVKASDIRKNCTITIHNKVTKEQVSPTYNYSIGACAESIIGSSQNTSLANIASKAMIRYCDAVIAAFPET